VRSKRAALALSATFVGVRLWSIAGIAPGIWNDTASYQRVADTGWWTRARWAGERPPLLPLVLTLTAGSERVTVWAQTIVSITCWLFLAWVVATLCSSTWDGRRLLGGGLVLALGISPPVMQWDGAVLSESLALSTTALVVACALRFVQRQDLSRAIALGAAAVAWGACRDTHLWLLGAVGAGLLVAIVVATVRHRRVRSLVILGVACVLTVGAVVGTAAADHGQRDEFPLSNAMSVRVLPYLDRIEWFADHGMPQADALARLARDPFIVPETGVRAVFVDGSDPTWSQYSSWLAEDGRRVYVEWLATHPGYVIAEPFRDPERVFNNGPGNWAFYRPHDARILPGTWILFPPWGVTLLGAAASTVIVVRAGRRSGAKAPVSAAGTLRRRAPGLRGLNGVWWFAVGVAALSVPHALLAWHGDGMEAARHALVACVQLRIGVVLMIAVAIATSARRSTPARGTSAELSTR
jgi:hypothetical protein